ncbi:Enamine deaminase RidA, house cleaning of reactive enamine intermediates, YjgF/YER057c/UK114 family [Pseudoxanthobacter soli DSM 19599]|uniref:Enamine deaminase RidA, house cleaning of reactive enamine intermediates, YjgF/YER057c/UK114 family n=1 Tax=Pseudoxanthobacter soli DSM 19599 TaxID=1123029 RepID=A0A1M7ZPB4_9HYPH|nr:RidA family protein [Pseudoxanthobacter soli]SHO66733.1 Enamine deaminase RidA, house cleaning of reactive enamine intermediates, YjgF/YER057c/UK114 family [Pseudoxanthobacter soli DSM 19599]
MSASKRVADLGLKLPSAGGGDDYYGKIYGKMKPHYLSDRLLFLSGQTAGIADGKVLYPGRLGRDLTVEEGYQAARLTGLNCLSCIIDAVGDLDRVTGLVRSLNFIACDPAFTEPHKVASGLTDLFEEVFGPEIGVGPRAAIGVMSLADDYCFETWVTVEIR